MSNPLLDPFDDEELRQELKRREEARRLRPKCGFTNVAKAFPAEKKVSVWTDGVILSTEESEEDRRAGFRPAFRLKAGKKYWVYVEELEDK